MIDPKLQAELRTRFNPDGSKLRIYQLRLFDILCYIDDLCKANNINYWLSSGTCLGAVRHEGFIPWDDDLDIEMLEEDYLKFNKVLSNIENEKYVFQNAETDPGYIYTFGKMRDMNSIIKESHKYDKFYKYKGCYVDVFHLIPSNSLLLHKIGTYIMSKEMMFRYEMLDRKNHITKLKYHILSLFSHIFIPILKHISSIKHKDIYRHFYGIRFYKARKYTDIFPLKLMKFESKCFPVPNDHDSYLKGIYGEYNSLPDINNIDSHLTNYDFL